MYVMLDPLSLTKKKQNSSISIIYEDIATGKSSAGHPVESESYLHAEYLKNGNE